MNSISAAGQPYRLNLVDPRTGAKANAITGLDPSTAVKFTQAETDEIKRWEAQTKAREDAAHAYAMQHPDKVYAQVVANGKLVATVYDSGAAQTDQSMRGMPETGEGTNLAESRLAYMAKSTGGKVIRSDFLPVQGQSYRGAPESALPSVTARSLDQILQDVLARSRIDAASRERVKVDQA